MKVKTSELTGSALDWAVAKIEGMTWLYEDLTEPSLGTMYSTDWSIGGPIIEREFIETSVMPCGNHSWATHHPSDLWLATKGMQDADCIEATGNTLLVAAMRCYVMSKLGTDIEIPEEFL